MDYRHMGRSGLTVSVVGLGCNNFGGRADATTSRSVIDAAIDAGITLFDTADIYGGGGNSESIIGETLGNRRDRIVLATKFAGDMGYNLNAAPGSRRYIRHAVHQSLRRLHTDWIDLYQMHFPDPTTPVEETLTALTELVREGTVRYIGCSNYAGWQIADADHVARHRTIERFISAQNQYSLLERDAENEVLPACAAMGTGVLPYFPLASGLLTGKYHRGQPAPAGTRLAGRPDAVSGADFDTIERLEALAGESGHSLLEIAFAGLLAQPMVSSVIAGATSPTQVTANAAAGAWVMSDSEQRQLRDVLSHQLSAAAV